MKTTYVNPASRLRPYMQVEKLRQKVFEYTQDTADIEANISTDGFFQLGLWDAEDGYQVPSFALEETHTTLDDFLLNLWDSPTARALINFAKKHEWHIIMAPIDQAAYDLCYEDKLLTLNNYNLRPSVFEKSGYFRQALMLSLIKGLRDIWHVECRQPYEAGLSIESILFLERVRAADCDISALLISWELRGAGTPEVWRHLIGTSEGDIAMRFSKTLESSPQKTFDGTALIEAFHEWFESPDRVAACDHQTLEMIDETLEEGDAAALYGPHRPAIEFIESLSRLPDKSRYLKGHGYHLLNDPHFCGLSEDVNQAHFLQIKQELESVTVAGVPFRNAELAAKIFPEDFRAS